MNQHHSSDSTPQNGAVIHPDFDPSSGFSSPQDPRLNSAFDPSDVTRHVKHDDLLAVQAAQLSDKSSSTIADNCALAGGDTPQTPHGIKDSCDSDKPKPRKKKPKKNRDNRVSVRFQDDEQEVLFERMERTGETLSQALRNIVLESTQKGGNILLSPKTPPEQLEALLGEIVKWRKSFAAAKPRLNMATPAHDDGRYAQVIAWRKEADRILKEIPIMEIMIQSCISALTNMTPEKVARWRNEIPTLSRWRDGFAKKGAKTEAALIQDLLDIIQDAGITLTQ